MNLDKNILLNLVIIGVFLGASLVPAISGNINKYSQNRNDFDDLDMNYGLVGHWNFDEGTSSVLNDDSGNNHDGTVYGASWVEGISGYALDFDGINDYVGIPGHDDLDILYWTVSAWIYADSVSEYDNIIVSKGEGVSHERHAYRLGIRSDVNDDATFFGAYEAASHDDPGIGVYSDPIDGFTGEWHHLVYTRGTDDYVRLYLDGVFMSETYDTDTPAITNSLLYFGVQYDHGGPGLERYFDGVIDEISLYNRSLSEDEIRNLTLNTGLISYWNFDNESNVGYDSSGNNHNGITQGAAWTSDGVIGCGAMQFDGIDDYFYANDHPDFDLQNWTLSAWVKITDNPTQNTFISKGEDPSTDRQNYWFGYYNNGADDALNGYFECIAHDDPGYGVTSTALSSIINNWHHVVYKKGPDNYQKLFFDGVLIGEAYHTRTPAYANSPLYVGVRFDNFGAGFEYFFKGLIDEVRIYSRVLNDSEITILYNFSGKPIAQFSYNPLNPDTQDMIQFNDTSKDTDGTITSWVWDFGDGNTSTEQHPTHQYTTPGTYTVLLNITDNDGEKDEVYKGITVNNTPPIADFSYSPLLPVVDELIIFTDTSIDTDGTITSWVWDFGDGNTSTEQHPTHQYSTTGNYTVCLNITDDYSETDEISKIIRVYNNPPVADFNYSPLLPYINESISFTDISVDFDGTITTWQWSFGDGDTSILKDPIHSYSTMGFYHVTLTVTDNDGDSNSISKIIPVEVDLSYIQDLSAGWNFVSLPFNESVQKTDFILKQDDYYYGLNHGIINVYMYGWDRIGQYYTFADTLEPGEGYWVFAYEDCELWIENITVTTDDYITTIESGWNVIGLSFDQTINKNDVIVHYDDSDHSWSQAVSDAIVVNFVYGWDRTGQYYNFAETFYPGYSYWVYASQECTLKRSV